MAAIPVPARSISKQGVIVLKLRFQLILSKRETDEAPCFIHSTGLGHPDT